MEEIYYDKENEFLNNDEFLKLFDYEEPKIVDMDDKEMVKKYSRKEKVNIDYPIKEDPDYKGKYTGILYYQKYNYWINLMSETFIHSLNFDNFINKFIRWYLLDLVYILKKLKINKINDKDLLKDDILKNFKYSDEYEIYRFNSLKHIEYDKNKNYILIGNCSNLAHIKNIKILMKNKFDKCYICENTNPSKIKNAIFIILLKGDKNIYNIDKVINYYTYKFSNDEKYLFMMKYLEYLNNYRYKSLYNEINKKIGIKRYITYKNALSAIDL